MNEIEMKIIELRNIDSKIENLLEEVYKYKEKREFCIKNLEGKKISFTKNNNILAIGDLSYPLLEMKSEMKWEILGLDNMGIFIHLKGIISNKEYYPAISLIDYVHYLKKRK